MHRRTLTLTLLLIAAACTRPPPPRPTGNADLSLEKVTMRSFSGTKARVITTADALEAWREVGTPGDLTARDAGVLLVRDGTRIRADVVTGNFLSGQLEGRGHVLLTAPSGLRAATSVVALDRTAGTGGVASSDAGVTLTQPGFDLDATSFSVDLAEEHVVFEHATTRISPRD